MWHYLDLVIHVQVKPRVELTGVEHYILLKVLAKDTSFFPMHRALALEDSKQRALRNDPSDSKASEDIQTLRDELVMMYQKEVAKLSEAQERLEANLDTLVHELQVAAAAVAVSPAVPEWAGADRRISMRPMPRAAAR